MNAAETITGVQEPVPPRVSCGVGWEGPALRSLNFMGMATDQWSGKYEVGADLLADRAALIGRAAAGRN